MDDGEEDDYVDYDSEPEQPIGSHGNGVDPYAGTIFTCFPIRSSSNGPASGIFFSKERREEVVEVEETPETFEIDGIAVPIMTQGEWMKGCPEGNEQGLLFQLYTQLSDGLCPCPNHCGNSIKRSKSLFFGFYVRLLPIVRAQDSLDMVLTLDVVSRSATIRRLYVEITR